MTMVFFEEAGNIGTILEVAKKRKLTIEQGFREAVRHWISTQIAIAEDPLFRLEPVKTRVETNSSKLDKALYGRSH